jgi:peptide/nickel transport system ATP-binding protein
VTESALRVENVSVAFGAVEAVCGVSFELGRGEVLGIVGESGSGKSVTCRAILGLLPPRARVAGRVLHEGRDLVALPAAEMQQVRGRRIAMIFQNPSSHLDPLMTIGGHVAEPLRRHFGLGRREARAQATELLEAVKIRDAAARYGAYPHQLSGGMKQRVLIASALACEPEILLADEPTTALDVTVQARILELLRELNRAHGLSTILVSHDLGVIAEICDRAVVMREGRVVETGPIAEVVSRPRHAYTRLLIGSQPGRLKAEPGAVGGQEPPLLEIEDLAVHFPVAGLPFAPRPPVRALDGVSLSVRAGECFGVVGESGSGKSTLARAVIRLVESTGGAIRHRGRDVAALSGPDLAAYRREVQMAFQSPYDSLNPRMTAIHTIAEPIWRHGLAAKDEALDRAAELMEQVELPAELAHRRPRELSGGQCQRVGIARALALSPGLLIADEITSALDVTIQAQILALLRRLRRERDLTILYISHDLAVVRRLCDRVAVFRAGRLIEAGPTERVFASPADPYTAELIAAAPDLDAIIASKLPAGDARSAGA